MVTFGTDGFVDYVQVPDGQRFMTGPVSIASLVCALAPKKVARQALADFSEHKQVMLPVDLDRMWGLLPFRRARFSSVANPLMRNNKHRTLTTSETGMDADKLTKEAIERQISRIEAEINTLQESGLSKESAASQVASLKNLIAMLNWKSPYGNQSKNRDFYVGPTKMAASEDESEGESEDDDAEEGQDKQASFAQFKVNTAMAEDIVSKVAATDEAIDRLVRAGERFNAVRAKTDLHKLASRVAEITSDVDMAQPWVGSDLRSLVRQANEIHDIFVTKK